MNKPFYLSLDLDFFNGVSEALVVKYLNRMTRSAQRKGIRIRAFMNHHHMLDAVSACPVRVLLNVDEHSDLSTSDCDELNCGTWVGYVSWRRKGTYIWYHSLDALAGDCTGGVSLPIFGYDSVLRANLSDWKNIKHKHFDNTLFDPSKMLENCIEIGVCQSPAYAEGYLHPIFHEWRKKYHIPYKWGRKHEEQAARRKPTFFT